MEDSGGRIRLYPLPSWSPESNPVEVVVVFARGRKPQPRVRRIGRLVKLAETISRRGSLSDSSSGRSYLYLGAAPLSRPYS